MIIVSASTTIARAKKHCITFQLFAQMQSLLIRSVLFCTAEIPPLTCSPPIVLHNYLFDNNFIHSAPPPGLSFSLSLSQTGPAFHWKLLNLNTIPSPSPYIMAIALWLRSSSVSLAAAALFACWIALCAAATLSLFFWKSLSPSFVPCGLGQVAAHGTSPSANQPRLGQNPLTMCVCSELTRNACSCCCSSSTSMTTSI